MDMPGSDESVNPMGRGGRGNETEREAPTRKSETREERVAKRGGNVALLKLVAAGNRWGRLRLAGMAVGIAVGVALLLTLVGAYQGFGPRSERAATGAVAKPNMELTEKSSLGPGRAAAAVMNDHYRQNQYSVLYVAGVKESGLTIPGVSTPPGPGQAVVSPRLKELIDASPDELAGRYGRVIGTISKAGLESPDAIVAVVGMTTSKLAASGMEAKIVTDFAGVDYASSAYRLIAFIGALATLIPVLLLIAIVTDLGSAQRAERFAALRLIGATPRRVASIAAGEIAVVSGAGTLLGICLYYACIPMFARIKVGSGSFYRSDLLLSPGAIAGTAALTVSLGSFVAWWRTMRADVGPLGQSREKAERPPRAVAVIPLLLGLVCLVSVVTSRAGSNLLPMLLTGGFLLTSVGLVIAGPFITRQMARIGMRRARRASTVIAFNRIARFPKVSFRTVSGMVVAIFMVTVFAIGITSVAGLRTVNEDPNHLPTSIVTAFTGKTDDRSIESARRELARISGVQTVAVGGFESADQRASVGANSKATDAGQADDRQSTRQKGGKQTGARKIILPFSQARALGIAGRGKSKSDAENAKYVSLNIGAVLLDDPLDVKQVARGQTGDSEARVLMVRTDGKSATVERVRTEMMSSNLALSSAPATRVDMAAGDALAPENQFATIAYIGITIAAALSAVSLAVSTISSVIQRRRVFGLMRLTGMPRAALREIVSIEAIVPVIGVFFACLAMGALTAWAVVFGVSEGKRSVGWPSSGFYAVLALCLVMVACSISATVKAAFRVTRGASVRFE